MKRRDFLAASAALSLFTIGQAQAAKQTPAAKKPVRKAPQKPIAKKPGTRAAAHASPAAAHTANGAASGALPPGEVRNVVSLPEEPAPHWQAYTIRSEVALPRTRARTRLWLPLVQYKDTPWERSLGHNWQGNFESAGIYRDPVAEMEVFYADWPEGAAEPRLQITSQVATQDRHFDITRRNAVAERTEVLRQCLQPTALIPTDGVVHRTAERAIGRVKDPLALGKVIYDWVVDNTIYDPTQKNETTPSISALLGDGPRGTNSAGIAMLFVGLCRSIGIPARPIFGLRVDRSRLFGSLGAQGNLSNAQHCRAEFYAPGYGWIPVDPADVRKAITEEQLHAGDPKLNVLKKLLFGFWEMNWIGFNAAQDVVLRGSTGDALPYLISPVVETPGSRLGTHDPERLRYSVTASRLDN